MVEGKLAIIAVAGVLGSGWTIRLPNVGVIASNNPNALFGLSVENGLVTHMTELSEHVFREDSSRRHICCWRFVNLLRRYSLLKTFQEKFK